MSGIVKYNIFEAFPTSTAAVVSGRMLPLFIFSIDGPKQNAGSLLTPVSNIVFYALSSGALYGRFLNHFLIGGNSSTANQNH